MELIILLLHGLFSLFKHKKKENSVGVSEIQPSSTNLINSKLSSPQKILNELLGMAIDSYSRQFSLFKAH